MAALSAAAHYGGVFPSRDVLEARFPDRHFRQGTTRLLSA
jgi:hypothetical protein